MIDVWRRWKNPAPLLISPSLLPEKAGKMLHL